MDILRRERDDAAEQIRILRTRIRDLDSAISILEGHPKESGSGRGSGDLKLSVLNKLKDAASSGGTPKEIADALTREGRATSDASVSSTLSRLKGEAKVINRSGRWFAANVDDDSQAGESPPHAHAWDDLDEDVPF